MWVAARQTYSSAQQGPPWNRSDQMAFILDTAYFLAYIMQFCLQFYDIHAYK
jgi:hypothetical protein